MLAHLADINERDFIQRAKKIFGGKTIQIMGYYKSLAYYGIQ